MPWQPLPRIAFAVASYPFTADGLEDLPLEIGDELYIIEETSDGNWLRGYLVAQPSLLAGLTSVKGQTLEARIYNGIFPRSCVEVREVLGDADSSEVDASEDGDREDATPRGTRVESANSGLQSVSNKMRSRDAINGRRAEEARRSGGMSNGISGPLSLPIRRNPEEPRQQAPVPMLKIGDETPTSASEPLIDEIASCLREWHSTNLHELLLTRQYAKLDTLSQLITNLSSARQQLLHNLLTTAEVDMLRERTVWDLVRVNKLCRSDVVVRDPARRGRILTGGDSVADITKLQSIMSLLDEPPHQPSDEMSLHHLLVDVRSMAGLLSSSIVLELSLASKPAGGKLSMISETYTVKIPAGGALGNLKKTQQAEMRTLFANLSAQDVAGPPATDTEIILVVKIRTSELASSGNPRSRSDSSVREQPGGYADGIKTVRANGAKAMRRSLMWAGKNARSVSSKSSPMSKLNEMEGDRPYSSRGLESRDSAHIADTATPKLTRTSTATSERPGYMVERLAGVGILRLNALMKPGQEVEQLINIWAPSAKFESSRQASDGWDPMIEDLISSRTGHYDKLRTAERVQIRLRAFAHTDSDALIKETPTALANIGTTKKMSFSGAPTKPRSDIYITIDETVLTRHTLIYRYGANPSTLPPSVVGNGLQVTALVRRNDGHTIDNCIHSSSNLGSRSSWKSSAVSTGEPWSQTLRLALTPEEVACSHLVLTLAEAPYPPFATAYLPLWEDQAFIRDGAHGLLLYKLDENTVSPNADATEKGGYLSLPWTSKTHSTDTSGLLATLQVHTNLCSTLFSQDRVLLALLKWKDQPKEDTPGLLKDVLFVAEIEIVKHLNEVLDALFAILKEWQGNDEYEDLVFAALIRVLDVTHDRRFNIAPLVDQYAESRFNCPFATPCLIRSFTRLLSKPTEPDTSRRLRATFKVVRHILKFINYGRDQQKAQEAGIGITATDPGFTRSLRSIFKALDAMMRNSAPVLVGSQTLAVQHFHTWLPELTGLLTKEEILHVAIDFLDSCDSVKGKLVLYKLVLIINYAKLDVFSQPEQRSALAANTVRWIAPHWGPVEVVTDQWKDQVRLCCSVLASQVDILGAEIPDHVPKILDSYLSIRAHKPPPTKRFSLLFPSSYPFPTKALSEECSLDEALIELSAILAALSNSPSGLQLELSGDERGITIENAMRVHMSELQGEAWPENWLSVHIYHHKSTMRSLQYISGILLDSFVPDPDDAESFNMELWKMFFTILLKLVASPTLALETFAEQKRRAVWKIAGDVREDGADLLRRTWEAIGWETTADERQRYGLTKMGGYQVQYVPALVGPIAELCLSVHQGLRAMAVEVLQTMIVSEWTLNEDLSAIQTEIIDSLDAYFKSKPLTESILQKLFVQELLDRFTPLSQEADEPLYAALRELMGIVDEYVDLLIAVHSNDGDREAANLTHSLRLMEFLRDLHKEEMFVRYVHQLADVQAAARNYTEAGLALRLHSELYDWDPNKTTPALTDPDYPVQSHFERKEKVYFAMIKHFEDGEAWGSALAAYKDLEEQYEDNVFDYAKLARTQRAIATIYERIIKSDKMLPKYYKVVFKGLGFALGVRDKEFIYEGLANERATGFADRMQEQYPAAQIVTGASTEEVEGQFLVISAVSPHRDLTHHVYQRSKVPQVIRDHLVSSSPPLFSVSSKRITTGPVTEHFAEKTVYTTMEPFPAILRRSEIVSSEEIRLNARQTALERTVRKTQEMTSVEKRILDGDKSDAVAQLLVDAISISVNPTSETSVAAYHALLPAVGKRSSTAISGSDEVGDEENVGQDEDDEEGEDEEEIVLSPEDNAVKMALIDHAIMIKRCIGMFAKSDNKILLDSYADLQRHFELTFAPELQAMAPPPQSPRSDASPSPEWPRSPAPLSPMLSRGHKHQLSSASASGVVEVSTVQPVSLQKGRGARLSFLHGKRKGSAAGSLQVPPVDEHRESWRWGNGSTNGDTSDAASVVSTVHGNGNGHDATARHAHENGKTVGRTESMESMTLGRYALSNGSKLRNGSVGSTLEQQYTTSSSLLTNGGEYTRPAIPPRTNTSTSAGTNDAGWATDYSLSNGHRSTDTANGVAKGDVNGHSPTMTGRRPSGSSMTSDLFHRQRDVKRKSSATNLTSSLQGKSATVISGGPVDEGHLEQLKLQQQQLYEETGASTGAIPPLQTPLSAINGNGGSGATAVMMKRLSKLRLGRKASKSILMASLDEE